MAFAFFFSIAIILGVTYVVSKKNLNVFEILLIWMVINVLHHNFLTITDINLKMFDFAHLLPNYWTLVFNRVVLIPLLMIWFFDRTAMLKPFPKWLWISVGVGMLTGVEYLAEVFHVFKYTRWKYGWSLIEWYAIFLIVNVFWVWYRKLLTKEAKSFG